MKKIFMICVVFLSFLLCGCINDSKEPVRGNDFVLSFDKDSDSKCQAHIVVEKDSKIVLDEKVSSCLDGFNIVYNPKAPDMGLLYSEFTFLKKMNENGKMYAEYFLKNKRMKVSTFETKDGGTSVQIPQIMTRNIEQVLYIEYGKKITVKEGTLVFEITYTK